jgi:hypothetical protein
LGDDAKDDEEGGRVPEDDADLQAELQAESDDDGDPIELNRIIAATI